MLDLSSRGDGFNVLARRRGRAGKSQGNPEQKPCIFFQKIVQNGTIGPNFEQSTRSFTDKNPPHGFNVLAEGLGFGMDLCEKV